MCVCVCVYLCVYVPNQLSLDYYSVCVCMYAFVCICTCDGKLTKIPKRDFIFARVKTGQVGT